jgi:hypothetical protein
MGGNVSNLGAIRSRLEALMRHAGGTDYAGQVIADNIALVAEVEQLRDERAAVVAWLRECALDPETTGAEMRLLQEHASRIERGEHGKGRDK